MERVIIAGFGKRFFQHQREILKHYSVSMIIDNNVEKTKIRSYLGCPLRSFEEICDHSGERILVVSQRGCTDIIKKLLLLGVDKERIIVWNPQLYLSGTDYSLSVNADGEVDAHITKYNLVAKLKASSDFIVFEEVFLKNTYRYVPNEKCILFDIGMNIGLASLFFASKNYISRIYGFEPFKPTYDRACENIQLNADTIRSKIVAHNYGLSDFEGEQTFEYKIDDPGGMRIAEGSIPTNKKNQYAETISVREAGKELSQIIYDNPNMFYAIKMDCEGSEYRIFDNMVKYSVIGKIKTIIMETHDGREDEIVSLLSKEGFIVYSNREGGGDDQTGMLFAVNLGLQ